MLKCYVLEEISKIMYKILKLKIIFISLILYLFCFHNIITNTNSKIKKYKVKKIMYLVL